MAPRRERTTAAASVTVEEPCEALSRWFGELSPLERLQAFAIKDVVWARMYMVLARKKPMQEVAEKEFEKEYVKAIFYMLQKQSDENHLSGNALPSPPSSDTSTETMGLLPSSRSIPSRPSTMFSGLQGGIKLLCGSLKLSSLKIDNINNQCEGDHEDSIGGEGDQLVPTVEAGNKLQETIRLCATRSTTMSEWTSYLNTIVVLQEVLADASSFLSLMSRASRSGFLSAEPSPALEKMILENGYRTTSNCGEQQLLELPWLQYRTSSTISMTDLLVNRLEIALWTSYWSAVRQHEEQQQQEVPLSPSSVLPSYSSIVKEERGNESVSVAESEAKGISLVPVVKEVITGTSSQPSQEIIPNFPSGLATTTAEETAPILDVLRTSTALVQFWSSKNSEEQLELVKDFGMAIDEVKEESGKRDGRTVEKLLLPPLSWVAKDCGEDLRIVVERIQAAYSADCVMEELLALEMGEDVCCGGGGSRNSSLVNESSSSSINKSDRIHCVKNRSKKLKKKKHQRLSGPQQQQNALCSSTISPMLSSEMVVDHVGDYPTILTQPPAQTGGCNSKNLNRNDKVPHKGVVVASSASLSPPAALIEDGTMTVDTQDTSTDRVMTPPCTIFHPTIDYNDGGGDLPPMGIASSPQDNVLNRVGAANASENSAVPSRDAAASDTTEDCGWREVVLRSRLKKEKGLVQNEMIHHNIDLAKNGGRCSSSSKQQEQVISDRRCDGNKRGMNNPRIKLRHNTTTSSNSEAAATMLPQGLTSNSITPGRGMKGQQLRKSKCYRYPEPSLNPAGPLSSQSFTEASSPHSSSAPCQMEAVGDSPSAMASISVAQDRTFVMETGSAASTDPTQPPSPSSASNAISASCLGISEHHHPSSLPQSTVSSQYCGDSRWGDEKKTLPLSFADVVRARPARYNSGCHKDWGGAVQSSFKTEAATTSAEPLNQKRILNTNDTNSSGFHDHKMNGRDSSNAAAVGKSFDSLPSTTYSIEVSHNAPKYVPRNLATAEDDDECTITASSIEKQSVQGREDGEGRCNGGLMGAEQRIGGICSSGSTHLPLIVQQQRPNRSEWSSMSETASFSGAIENPERILDAAVIVNGDSRKGLPQVMVPEQQPQQSRETPQEQHSSTYEMQMKEPAENKGEEVGKSSQHPSAKKSSTSAAEGDEGFMTDVTATQNTSNSSSSNLVNTQGVGSAAPPTAAAASVANSSTWFWMGDGIAPWMVCPDYSVYNETVLVKHLDTNIETFMRKLFSVMRLKRLSGRKIVESLTKIVCRTWKEARVEVYGSCYTGLELPSSDVDVVVCGIGGREYEYGKTPKDPYNLNETVEHLRLLATALECEPWVCGMKVIETASIPVIKILADPRNVPSADRGGVGKCMENHMSSSRASAMADPSVRRAAAATTGGHCPPPPCIPCTTGNPPQEAWPWVSSTGTEYVPLDVTFSSPMHGGIGSSKWVRDNIQNGKYRCCLPATLIIKEILCQRGLNQPWSGGLSSYSLINMMITVLQGIEKQRLRDQKLEALANLLWEERSNSDTSDGSGGIVVLPVVAQQQQQQQQQTTRKSHDHSQSNSLSGEEGLVRSSLPSSSAANGVTSMVDLDCAVVLTERELLVEDTLADISPGLCLLRFLEYYGRVFHNRIYGISVGRGILENPFLLETSVADKENRGVYTSAPGIVIEDPMNMSTNVAHSCFGFPQVQWLFSNFLSALQLRGPEILGYDRNANLLQLLGYF